MKDKIRKENNNFDIIVTVGVVGHIPVDFLPKLKKVIESLEMFDLVIFKTSSGRLWIKEGDNND